MLVSWPYSFVYNRDRFNVKKIYQEKMLSKNTVRKLITERGK